MVDFLNILGQILGIIVCFAAGWIVKGHALSIKELEKRVADLEER